jgi:hypothetical protein
MTDCYIKIKIMAEQNHKMTDCYIKIKIMAEQNSKNDWKKSQNN